MIRFGASLRLGQALLKPERFGSEPSVRRVYRGVPGACVRPLLGCCHLGGVREVSRALLSSQQQQCCRAARVLFVRAESLWVQEFRSSEAAAPKQGENAPCGAWQAHPAVPLTPSL